MRIKILQKHFLQAILMNLRNKVRFQQMKCFLEINRGMKILFRKQRHYKVNLMKNSLQFYSNKLHHNNLNNIVRITLIYHKQMRNLIENFNI